ncbi:autophagy protein 13 [Rhizina undulata]
MYGRDSPQLPWAPPRRRATGGPQGDENESSTRRFSIEPNYTSNEGSETTSMSGGFTTISAMSGGGGRPRSSGEVPERSARDKINQIVQAFFGKAAMVIIQSRMTVNSLYSSKTGVRKVNKWFNIELDDTDAFQEELKLWRTCDSFDPRPPTMIIETYLDASDLTPNQSLVIVDADGKRWNVNEALDMANARAGLNTGSVRNGRGNGRPEVILERWTIKLSNQIDSAHTPELPIVYKKGIVMFRALYSYAGLMPTCKFRKRLSKVKLNTSTLKVNCRILSDDDCARLPHGVDGLTVPLYENKGTVVQDFDFGSVESPAGVFNIQVSFRTQCDFRVDDSEALLSSHFLHLDERYFEAPSNTRPSSQPLGYTAAGRDSGSLPSAASQLQRPEYTQTYGSLSTFHQLGPAGASPLAALRAAGDMGERSPASASPAGGVPMGLRSVQGSKSSLRSIDVAGMQRRSSVSFMQPFKSPSLSASPASSDPIRSSSPRPSLGRVSTPLAAAAHRSRPSCGTMSPSSYKSCLHAEPPTSHGGAPPPTSTSSSRPQSTAKITSSFGTRRPRISSGASRTEDDNNSSEKASFSSSAAPGPDLYATTAASANIDEDIQIRDFMSMLADGQKQTLKSFQASGPEAESSSRRAGNALSKFQKMRDSQSALADSMSSSLLLAPSSGSPSTSSRHLSNVPGMVPSTAFSSSSSPGKPISPHTPHTPAIPSRLSEGLTAQYDQQARDRHLHHRPRSTQETESGGQGRTLRSATEDQQVTTATTSPLDIPSSPRTFGPRRSNSLSQQHHETLDGENSGEYNMNAFDPTNRQSVSLGDGAPQLSLSRLMDLRAASETALPGREQAEAQAHGQHPDHGDESLAFGPPRPPSMDSAEGEPARFQPRYSSRHAYPGVASSGSYRGRFTTRRRGSTPPTGSTASLERERAVSGTGNDRPNLVGRRTPSYTSRHGQYTEDEELLFAMSDMMVAQQSRRSIEQDRAESSTSSSSRRRSRGGSAADNLRGGW